jgi:hypothetical protein
MYSEVGRPDPGHAQFVPFSFSLQFHMLSNVVFTMNNVILHVSVLTVSRGCQKLFLYCSMTKDCYPEDGLGN